MNPYYNQHALKVGDKLYWRHKYLREKHGDTVTVTGIQKGEHSSIRMVRLQTETGTELKWYLDTVRAKLMRIR